MQKNVLILGSTGSIGCSTLDVIRQHSEKFKIKTLISHTNIEKLLKQAVEFKPESIALYDESYLHDLKETAGSLGINAYVGKKAIQELLLQEYDVVIAAIVGMACLHPLMQLMPNAKVIGLANKESIVCAGSLLMKYAHQCGTKIVPVDSEHSAIFQVLEDSNHHNISKVILTASGGPFLNFTLDNMKSITPADAVSHPVWNMGSKISIDSATMMNKGLELIEAHYLFNIDVKRLHAVVHPQALVHGMVQYDDGAMLMQMALPDMRTPISLALNYPKRLNLANCQPTLEQMSNMTFKEIDVEKFRCFKLAQNALGVGQGRCIQLNTANEIAVRAFLSGFISFLNISKIIEETLNALNDVKVESLQDVFEIAAKTSEFVQSKL